MKHYNLEAYDNYEIFTDESSESSYREAKLRSCEKQVRFIKKIVSEEKISVLELGSGNSKLPINLYKNNLLSKAYALEVSKSRSDFAKKWAKDLNVENIENINDDFINFDYTKISEIDLCYCVDLVFQFCEPTKNLSSFNVLNQVYNKLSKNGTLILELDGCDRILKSLEINSRIWEEFPETDPWKYSLWECSYEKKVLNWKKTFISRKFDIEETFISLRIYTKEEIKDILKTIGFKTIEFYSNWDGDDYVDDLSEYILVAKK